ncbi:MAG TPA: type II toxin-antitoxin system Y4mF family antitoxin [Nannocystaceae bacterium]|nr:type II toxin-antitoxin system Y4mF family antitoxin [Nannocystaceae bacterium]
MNDGLARTPAELGALVRARRRALGATQIELAALADVGARFVVELERGKPTLELGRVMRVLAQLGLELVIRERDGAGR